VGRLGLEPRTYGFMIASAYRLPSSALRHVTCVTSDSTCSSAMTRPGDCKVIEVAASRVFSSAAWAHFGYRLAAYAPRQRQGSCARRPSPIRIPPKMRPNEGPRPGPHLAGVRQRRRPSTTGNDLRVDARRGGQSPRRRRVGDTTLSRSVSSGVQRCLILRPNRKSSQDASSMSDTWRGDCRF